MSALQRKGERSASENHGAEHGGTRRAARAVGAPAMLVLLGGMLGSQSTLPPPPSVLGGVKYATLDTASGTLVRTGGPTQACFCPTIWANTDWSGHFDLPNIGEEWLDWGSINVTMGSDTVCGFTFGYATTALDTTIGGPGASLCTSFYDGARGWCAESGTGILPDRSLCFSGLPGSPNGGVSGWVIRVVLDTNDQFDLGTGPFGYSVHGTDGLTGPLLSFAGNGAGSFDGQGQEDAFDIYVPDVASGTCDSYFYGGGPQNFASFYLSVEGESDCNVPATKTPYVGDTNPKRFTVLDDPVLGTLMKCEIQAAGPELVVGISVAVGSCFETPAWGMFNGTWLLPPPTWPSVFSAWPMLGHLHELNVPVPCNLSLCGLPVCVQGMAGFYPWPLPQIQLLNGYDLVLGF